MISKDQITERKRGRGGTLIRVRPGARVPVGAYGSPRPTTGRLIADGVYVVKDLFQRKEWNVPDEVGVGPVDRGIAFAVKRADIAAIVEP